MTFPKKRGNAGGQCSLLPEGNHQGRGKLEREGDKPQVFEKSGNPSGVTVIYRNALRKRGKMGRVSGEGR